MRTAIERRLHRLEERLGSASDGPWEVMETARWLLQSGAALELGLVTLADCARYAETMATVIEGLTEDELREDLAECSAFTAFARTLPEPTRSRFLSTDPRVRWSALKETVVLWRASMAAHNVEYEGHASPRSGRATPNAHF